MNIQTNTERMLSGGLTAWELFDLFPDELSYYHKQLLKRTKPAREQLLVIKHTIHCPISLMLHEFIIRQGCSDLQLLEKVEKAMTFKSRNFQNSKTFDIEKAKQFPIEELFSFEKKRRTAKRVSVSCPFHSDSSPSFVIYLDNNRFHCFSCQAKGSSIDFIMKLQNKSFVQAVEALS
jgi:hypothetical protein